MIENFVNEKQIREQCADMDPSVQGSRSSAIRRQAARARAGRRLRLARVAIGDVDELPVGRDILHAELPCTFEEELADFRLAPHRTPSGGRELGGWCSIGGVGAPLETDANLVSVAHA